jgi:hypothetical protein
LNTEAVGSPFGLSGTGRNREWVVDSTGIILACFLSLFAAGAVKRSRRARSAGRHMPRGRRVRIALNEQQFALLLAIYGVIGATFLVKGLT